MDLREDAKHLLSSEVLRSAYQRLDEKIVDDWRIASTPEKRERLWIKQQLLGELREGIEKHASVFAE